MGEGTLVIGWVVPTLVGILLLAFTAGTRVFEWLGALVSRYRLELMPNAQPTSPYAFAQPICPFSLMVT